MWRFLFPIGNEQMLLRRQGGSACCYGEACIDMESDCVRWSIREVGGWIRLKGFPQYEACFTDNYINGRKLIHVQSSTLPMMGITDFEDIKIISRLIRDLLDITEPTWDRSISLPHRDNMGLFLEQKSRTGVSYDSLTYKQFVSQQGLEPHEA